MVAEYVQAGAHTLIGDMRMNALSTSALFVGRSSKVVVRTPKAVQTGVRFCNETEFVGVGSNGRKRRVSPICSC